MEDKEDMEGMKDMAVKVKAGRLAIFDLDGTLLDTVRDLGNATNHALRMCGYPERPVDDYYQLVGRGIYNLFRGATGSDDEAVVQEMASYFIPYYDAHKCDFTHPYPGIEEMLAQLAGEGVALAVASNKYQDGTEKLVRRFFGDIPFAAVYGQVDGRPIKPDPAIVSLIMEGVPGVDRSKVVYAGDSNVDMQTGLAAGVHTVGVTWGFRSRGELEACGPHALVDTPAQLASEILGI